MPKPKSHKTKNKKKEDNKPSFFTINHKIEILFSHLFIGKIQALLI